MDSYSISEGKSLAKGFRESRRKRLEEEQERLAEQAQAQAEQDLADQAQEDDAPLYKKAAGFLSGAAGAVGGLVKDTAVDLYKTTDNAVRGNVDVIQGSISAERERSRQLEESSIVNRNNRRLEQLLGDDINNPNSIKWDTPEAKKIIQESNEELQNYRDNSSGQRDNNQRNIQESQDVDAKGVAADTAETFLNTATLGTGTGIKALGKAGAKEGLELGIKTIAKRGAKDILKAGARGAAEGAVFGGAAGLTDSVSEGMDAEDAVANIAKQAALGGVLGGATSGISGGLDVRKGNKAAKVLDDARVANEADIAKVGTDIDDVVDSLDNPLREVPDEELKTQLNDILDGKSKSGDVEADYKKVQSINDELNSREATNYFANDGRSVDDIQKEIDDLDSGAGVPDTGYKPAAPVKSIDEVLKRPDVPIEIRNAATEISNDRRLIEEQMDGLMSPKVKADEIARLDEHYDMQIQDLTRKYSSLEQPVKGKDTTVSQKIDGQKLSGDYKSDVRFQMAKEQMDLEYKERRAELDLLEAEDLDQVTQYQGMLDTIDNRAQNIVADTRNLMQSYPDRFRDIDEVEVGAHKAELETQLEQAKRFTDRKNVIESNSQSADPVKNVETKPEVREAVAQEAVDEVEQIPSQFKSQDDSLMVMKAISPSQWFQKRNLRGGADGAGANVHADIIKGLTATNKANLDDAKILQKIKNILPGNKEIQKQIVEYIEGSRKTLSAVGDSAVAKDIQSFLDMKRKELTDIGLGTRDDYFPHIWDKSDPKVQERFSDRATGEINFNNVKQRIADAEDYSTDIMDVLAQYTSGVNRKIHLEPALKPLSDLKTQVSMTNAEAKYIDLYINQIKGLNKSDIQRGVNKGLDDMFSKVGITKGLVGTDHYAKVLGTQRMVSAISAMGFNPGTIIRNGTQAVNTIADIGPKYSLIGSIDGTRMLATREGIDELKRVGVIDGGVSQNFTDLLEDASVKGKITNVRDKAVWAMMAGIRGTDIMLRAQAYAGAKALAKSKGLVGEAAENFAINKVVDTQFMTSAADMPIAFNGQGVRSLTQLAAFSGKQAGFMKRMGVKMVKGEDGKGFRMKDAGNVMAGVATMAIMTEALKPIVGFNEKEWVPFYDQIAPFLSPLTGDDASSGESLYRSPLIRLMMGDGKSKDGLVQALQSIGKEDADGNKTDAKAAWESFWEDNWSNLVPAGTQIKKTTEGLQTTSSGTSRNSSGNIRFKQDQSGDKNVNSILGMDIDPQLQSALFGQYSTQAGQKWIQEGFPTLSTSQTKSVDEQVTPEAKQQYIDFYNARKAAPGRQKAYDEIKAAAKSGDSNKATRVASEYNDTVKQAMAGYYQQHDELPKELREELTSGLYINVNKVIESAKDK